MMGDRMGGGDLSFNLLMIIFFSKNGANFQSRIYKNRYLRGRTEKNKQPENVVSSSRRNHLNRRTAETITPTNESVIHV